jgi:transposase
VRQGLPERGFRLRRWRHRPLQAKSEAPAAFRDERGEGRVAWPADWELRFVEEAMVRRHPTLTAPWGLVEDRPAVPTGDDHPKVPVDGAVAPLTGRPHDQVNADLGHEELAPFLRHLVTYSPGQRLLVSHERGAQHTGAAVEDIIRASPGQLRLTPQPAYSPELNPHERLWKWWRRLVTHHHWWATLREQVDAIRHVFRYLVGVQEQVQWRCSLKPPASLVASL